MRASTNGPHSLAGLVAGYCRTNGFRAYNIIIDKGLFIDTRYKIFKSAVDKTVYFIRGGGIFNLEFCTDLDLVF